MGFVLPRPQRIQPLPEPSFFGPGPVTIRVGVELRRFHDDLRMAQQSPCHISYVKFQTIFQKSLACLNENRYLPPNFERSTAKNTHPRRGRDRRAREGTVIAGRKATPWSGEIGKNESVGRDGVRLPRKNASFLPPQTRSL